MRASGAVGPKPFLDILICGFFILKVLDVKE